MDVPPILLNLALISTTIVLLVCYYLQGISSYWRRRGVPYVSAWRSFRLFSDVTRRITLAELFHAFYEELEGHKFGGAFQMQVPVVILRDPEVIKVWLIKNFSNFCDRNLTNDEEAGVFSNSQLFQLTGEKWRTVRQKLSAGFSSAKLKIMYQTLIGCAEDLDSYLRTLCSETGETEVDVKELMSNYAMDVIGACAMGIKCNAIRDKGGEFKENVRRMLEFDAWKSLYFMLEALHPKLPRLVGLKLVPTEVTEFLQMIIKEAIAIRAEENSSERKDFLQIMMNLRACEIEKTDEINEESIRKEEAYDGSIFTEDILVGTMGTFLSAGLETTAATLIFCLYELALHPEIQDRVLQEIEMARGEIGTDHFNYEDLRRMNYTVINETLRKYPVAHSVVRLCTAPFKIPDSDVIIERGVKVFAPIYSIHHDPKYFPEPETFDPERFSKENIDKIVPGSYIPFGDGPRSCIAMRMALLTVIGMLITMVSNYTLHPCARTEQHIQFDKETIVLNPVNGLWLKIQYRKLK